MIQATMVTATKIYIVSLCFSNKYEDIKQDWNHISKYLLDIPPIWLHQIAILLYAQLGPIFIILSFILNTLSPLRPLLREKQEYFPQILC